MRRLALTFVFLVAGLCACGDNDPVWVLPPDRIENPAEVIETLASAYRTKDYPLFESLLANDYTYFLNEPDSVTGETQWDRTTELRIHRRLFDPENIPQDDPPSPPAQWLQSISVTFMKQSAFDERPDLYTTAMPPGPLDPARWIATAATYGADILIQTQGETDFQLRGRCTFVVIEDRAKVIGDAGKFTIYQWADLDGSVTSMKQLFRERRRA